MAILEAKLRFAQLSKAEYTVGNTIKMVESNKDRRERIKRELLAARGGKCCVCGYCTSISALCFHHRNPEEKEFNISGVRLTRQARANLDAEAAKCDIYCQNCHAELHDREGWVHEDGKRTPK